MARFFGAVGYGESTQDPDDSDIWEDVITERNYYGDIVRNTRALQSTENLNPDIVVANSISIVSDQYAIDYFHNIKYVDWNGVLFTVTSVEVRAPRLILTVGSVYNGPSPRSS